VRPLLALVLAVVAVTATASAAAPSRPLTIQFRLGFTLMHQADGGLSGTFRATGAIAASGRVAEDYLVSPPRLRDQQPVETVFGRSTLTAPSGSLTIRYSGVVSSASPTQTVTEGRWTIEAATGRFHGVRGSGRLSAIVDLARRTMVKRYDGLVSAPTG
jgi:hypothetical protein